MGLLGVAVSRSRSGRAGARGAWLYQSGGRRDDLHGHAPVQREVDRLPPVAVKRPAVS